MLYSHLFDSHRTDDMAMIFTEDAVCEFSDDLPYGDWVGRDEIRKQYKEVASHSTKPFSYMHATTNGWVELTGPDSATGSWFLLDLGMGDNPQPGGPDRRLQRCLQEGRWRVVHPPHADRPHLDAGVGRRELGRDCGRLQPTKIGGRLWAGDHQRAPAAL